MKINKRYRADQWRDMSPGDRLERLPVYHSLIMWLVAFFMMLGVFPMIAFKKRNRGYYVKEFVGVLTSGFAKHLRNKVRGSRTLPRAWWKDVGLREHLAKRAAAC